MEDEIRTSTSAARAAVVEDEAAASPTQPHRPLASLSDDDLLLGLSEILSRSRRVEKDLVAHIAEVDERRLYAREAFPSMFAYCTDALHLSEGEAYLRIAVARASREHPILLEMLGDGRLHLSGIALLAPHLTPENRDGLLRRATHRSKKQIEELVAEVAPRADAPSLIRKLPDRTNLSPSPSPPSSWPPGPTHSGMGISVARSLGNGLEAAPDSVCLPIAPDEAPVLISPAAPRPVPSPVVQPLSPGRYRVQFTASAALRDKLERLQALMRSQVPDGDLGAIIEAAVTERLERLEAHRYAMTTRPRQTLSEANVSAASHHIPAAVRRAVRERDGNQCAYVDASGRRCGERHRLEYHHRHPLGLGGDHRPDGIGLVCRAHNLTLAEHDYGREAMARFRRSGENLEAPRDRGH